MRKTASLFMSISMLLVGSIWLNQNGEATVQAQTTPTVRTLNILVNEMVYNPISKKLYASVPSSAGSQGNSITVIDPVTGTIGPSVFVGSEPNKLALSDDGKYLYVGLDGSASVRRVNLQTLTPEIQFTLGNDSFSGPFLAADLAVMPGCADVLLVARATSSSSFGGNIAVYDNGARRVPAMNAETFSGSIAFGTSPITVFAFGGSSGGDLRRLSLVPEGLKLLDNLGGGLTGNAADFKVDGNLIFTPTGRVYDPMAKIILGTFSNVSSGLVEPDTAQNKTFFLAPSSSSSGAQTYRILAFNQSTFLPSGTLDVPNVNGTPRSFLRYGADGLAFNVRGSNFGSAGNPQIFLVNSPAIIGGMAPTVITSSASFRTGLVAPNAITTIFGSLLATTTATADAVPLPTSLGNTTVKVKDNAGSERLAQLLFVSPTQVNFLVPAETIPGPAMLTVTPSNGSAVTANTIVAPVAPGLFTANADGAGVPAAVAVRVKANNEQTLEAVAQRDTTTNKFVPRPLDLGPNLGANSDRVFLVLFGTGWRRRSSLTSVIARVGCDEAPVSFVGSQGTLAGLDQINLLIPRSQIGRGEVDVVLTIDGTTTNPVKINLR